MVVPPAVRSRRAAPAARLAAALLGTALLTGCSLLPEFPDRGSGEFRPKPEIGPAAGPQPQVPGIPGFPGQPQPPDPDTGQALGPPQGCNDPDPAVVATCLAPIGAIAMLPGGQSALVAERTTGRIVRVERGTAPVEIARLPVEPAGGGGVTGLALSPSYAEDELIYAYVVGPAGGAVLRIAPDDTPKPVLTGIPGGAGGALGLDGTGAILVATGAGGDPASAADPSSLAGKLLRIDTFGAPAAGNPDPASAVVASGLQEPAGMCTDPATATTWVTDAGPEGDVLRKVVPGEPLGPPAWTWADEPGAAGCVVSRGRMQVALTDRAQMFLLDLGPGQQFVGEPGTVPLERYGRVSAAALAPDGTTVWLGTVNTEGGTPVSSDERVFQLPETAGGGGQD